MEVEIKVEAGDSLESIVYLLLAARARGEKAFANFNGHILHSDTVSLDSAYDEIFGYTKAEFDKAAKEMEEKMQNEELARKIREQGYAKKIEVSRNQGKYGINYQNVINGLKFIAEHRSMSQDELIDGLLQLGCNFSIEDIKQQFPNIKGNLSDGMSQGSLACGANIIVNMRNTEYGRGKGDEKFLSVDSEDSIYNFIRIVTGDETYTKKYVDSLSNSSEIQR